MVCDNFLEAPRQALVELSLILNQRCAFTDFRFDASGSSVYRSLFEVRYLSNYIAQHTNSNSYNIHLGFKGVVHGTTNASQHAAVWQQPKKR